MAERDRHALTPEQKTQAVDWLQAHWTVPSKACPISGHNSWEISDYVVQPMTHIPLGTTNIGGGPAYPMVLLTCGGCGFTLHFNAVKMGLFPSTPATEKNEVADAKA